MKYTQHIKGKNKAAFMMVCIFSLVFILNGCGSSSSSVVTTIIGGDLIDISGIITDAETSVPLADVNVEGIYSAPGDAQNSFTITAADGRFVLTVLKDSAVYLRATKAGYTSLNTARIAYSADEPGFDIEFPASAYVQSVINTAFPGMPRPKLGSFAWLAAGVFDITNGDDIGGVTIMPAPVPTAGVHTNCDGTASAGGVTVAPCVPDRQAPMYFAYFKAAVSTVTVSVSSGAAEQTGPLARGEITSFEFEQ